MAEATDTAAGLPPAAGAGEDKGGTTTTGGPASPDGRRVSGTKIVAAILAIAAVAGLAAAWYRTFVHIRHFAVVEEGVLFRCAQMNNDTTQRRLFARTGAKTVVILRSVAEHGEDDWLPREKRIAAEMGVEVRLIPMEYDTAPTPAQVREFLAIMDDPARRPVVVHCEVGAIRTGVMVAAWRMERCGWDGERSAAEYIQRGHGHAEKEKRRDLVEWIRNYRPQSTGVSPAGGS